MKTDKPRRQPATTVSFAETVPGLTELALKRFVRRAADAVSLSGAVNVRVARNEELQNLNRQFRRKNVPTDVLSFPAPDGLAGSVAGDIAISVDIAAANAESLGHSTAQEIKILALHGILHLAGHDHERDAGEMATLEQRLRRKLLLPVSLIERQAGAAELKPLQRRAKPAPRGRAR